MKKMSKTRLIVSLIVVALLYVGAWYAETQMGANNMLITMPVTILDADAARELSLDTEGTQDGIISPKNHLPESDDRDEGVKR